MSSHDEFPDTGNQNATEQLDWPAIEQLESFKQLERSRAKFAIPVMIFFFPFYLGLPLLAAFTKVLTHPVLGSITWAWIYAFAQFVMTWTFCMVYLGRAKKFDKATLGVIADAAALQGK
jgi:uncharacterized membrane protein (DUF485 family)